MLLLLLLLLLLIATMPKMLLQLLLMTVHTITNSRQPPSLVAVAIPSVENTAGRAIAPIWLQVQKDAELVARLLGATVAARAWRKSRQQAWQTFGWKDEA